MEYGVGVIKIWKVRVKFESLNPSFCGIWCRVNVNFNTLPSGVNVLILLLVEYGVGCAQDLLADIEKLS